MVLSSCHNFYQYCFVLGESIVLDKQFMYINFMLSHLGDNLLFHIFSLFNVLYMYWSTDVLGNLSSGLVDHLCMPFLLPPPILSTGK